MLILKGLNAVICNMRKTLEKEKKHIELFTSINNQICIELTSKERVVSNTLITGVCCTKFDDDGLSKYTCVDGLNEKSLLDSLRNPCTGIANRKNNKKVPTDTTNDYDLKNLNVQDIYIDDYYHREHFYDLKDKFAPSSLTLEKVYVQLEQNIYIILDTLGNSGYGVQGFFSPVYEFLDKNLDRKVLIYSIFDSKSDLSQEIAFLDTGKRDAIDIDITGMPILLTSNVVGKLVYLLTLLLTDNNINNNYTFLKTLDKSKFRFSELLDIEENSEENKIIIGTVDGCCNKRIKKKIIENGVIKSIIGSTENMQLPYKGIGASEFRVDFRRQPVVKGQKISIRGGEKSLSKLMADNPKLLVIDDLIGIENSINPNTTEFTAVINGILIIKGDKQNFKKQVSSSLTNILNSIIEISSDKEYSVDGSILAPSILISHFD